MEVLSAAGTEADACIDPVFKCTDYAVGMGKLLQRMVVQPVTRLLRRGASPEQLAWSMAVGIVVGVNPLLGSTTLVVLALAAVFRLNVVASQVGNHAMYLPEIALFPVFVKLGSVVFSTQKLPLEGHELLMAVKAHPWDMTKVLWMWEWHALVVWAMCAVVALPVIALGLRPVLTRALRRVKQQPVDAS
jgi:uncharacterized protein (DUF2062 family)